MVSRNRVGYGLLLALTMSLGLASRRFGAALPAWVAAYAGDTLWALLVFWLVGVCWPQWPSKRVGVLAAGFAVAIELSQLCQAPWLHALRHTTLGSLVLGQGFLWSDLLCYAVGLLAGLGAERLWLPENPSQTPSSSSGTMSN